MVSKDEIVLEDFEIAAGWKTFSAKWPHNDVEFDLRHFLAAENKGDWLHKARISSLLSLAEVARRLKISESAYHKLENRAKSGEISLNNLQRCAEAMDCEVVWAIRPKSRIGFSVRIWQFLLAIVRKDERLKIVAPDRRGFALARYAEWLLYDPKFRKAQGWARNCEEASRETRKMIEIENIRPVADPDALDKMLACLRRQPPKK